MAPNSAHASPPLGSPPCPPSDRMGEGRGARPSPLGALPLVCTIGFRSAEGGKMELPDSESVCACACVHVCLCVCLSVCLSDSPWTWGSRGQG